MALLIILLILTLIIISYVSINPSRHKKIDLIIRDLLNLKDVAPSGEQYAIAENIKFFQAIQTLPGYILWIINQRNKIDATRLLEIADLPLARWEKELYHDLDRVERKKFPGLSKPLRNLLVDQIKNKPDSIILDLGCGGMEVVRQVLVKLDELKINHRSTFIGIDTADQAWIAISETFNEFQSLIRLEKINTLTNIRIKNEVKPAVLFYRGDALEIAEMHGHKFDLIFSSRFRHHLSNKEKKRIDNISKKISNTVIEYDDYRTAVSWIPPIFTAWNRPILLNGAIFSQIRQPAKNELMKIKSGASVNVQLFNPPGSYAKVYAKYKTNSRK